MSSREVEATTVDELIVGPDVDDVVAAPDSPKKPKCDVDCKCVTTAAIINLETVDVTEYSAESDQLFSVMGV